MTNIEERHVTLPKWLDDLLFCKLSASYCRKNKNLVVLKWKRNEILEYLGTYFPRSYAESYCIFSKYFKNNKLKYQNKTEIAVFDFGCGTGGELVGFITALHEQLPSIKTIHISALDGNAHALLFLEEILETVSQQFDIKLDSRIVPVEIDDFYDMGIVTDIITQSFDFIISFKAICEFVSEQQFEDKNPYERIINEFSSKLISDGIICLADITTFSPVSEEWLPKMLDAASNVCNVEIYDRNEGFNEEYRITHSQHLYDISKIAWRIYQGQQNI